jgi:hypothetical protein
MRRTQRRVLLRLTSLRSRGPSLLLRGPAVTALLEVSEFQQLPHGAITPEYIYTYISSSFSCTCLGLFYDCSPFSPILWISSSIYNAHYLQIIFNWAPPCDSRSAYWSSTSSIYLYIYNLNSMVVWFLFICLYLECYIVRKQYDMRNASTQK